MNLKGATASDTGGSHFIERKSGNGEAIAHAVTSALEMDGRGFMTALTVSATNPKD